jgi:hypothetical protein
MNTCKAIWHAKAVLACLLVASCSLLQQRPLQPTDKTAVVRAGQWGKIYRGGYVELAAVSGVNAGWRLHSDLSVTPGMLSGVYYIYSCAQDYNHCISIAEANVTFEAEAGHTYQVRAREQVSGSNRFWVWVVDEAGGQVVGGTPPSTGSNNP